MLFILLCHLLCDSCARTPPPPPFFKGTSTQVEHFRFPLQACRFLELPKSQLLLVKAPSRMYQRMEQMPITEDGIGWGRTTSDPVSQYVRIETQVTFSSLLFVHPGCPQLTWQVYAWTSVCAQVRVCGMRSFPSFLEKESSSKCSWRVKPFPNSEAFAPLRQQGALQARPRTLGPLQCL